MNTTEIYTIFLKWINNTINESTSVDLCTFTNGSKIISGTNFVSGGIIQNDGYIKKSWDFNYSKIESFTDTEITLYENYEGTDATDISSVFFESFIPVIRGEQSAPKPSKNYIVIHQPMSVMEYASGNYSKADSNGIVTYENHLQGTVSLEEVGFADNGDKLRKLITSLRLQPTMDYFKNSKVSILRNEGVQPIPQLTENIWELRSDVDLIILFPDEGTYISGFIETVEFTGTYN